MNQKGQQWKIQYELFTLNRDFLWTSGALQMAVATYPGSSIVHILEIAHQFDKTFETLLKVCERTFDSEDAESREKEFDEIVGSAYIELLEQWKLDNLCTYTSFKMSCLITLAADCTSFVSDINRILLKAGVLKNDDCKAYINSQLEAIKSSHKYEHFRAIYQYIEKNFKDN